MKLLSKTFVHKDEQELENIVEAFSETVIVLAGHSFTDPYTSLNVKTITYYESEQAIITSELLEKFLSYGKN